MQQALYDAYVNILREELRPAMGCTEPIAVAYAAAIARAALQAVPDEVLICVSGNILKNVKSVIVPNTNGLKGLPAAAAAGVIGGDERRVLEVLSALTPEQIVAISDYLSAARFEVRQANSGCLFDIEITLKKGAHTAYCRIMGAHTNVVLVKRDDAVLYEGCGASGGERVKTDRSLLTVENIVTFANEVAMDDVREVLDRQIAYNMAIATEGLKNAYGARIGQILLECNGDNVLNRAKAMAAAGSDARMNGCELPVVINSGSGNQGMTASIPVIVYAGELSAPQDKMYRALIISNLITIHLKTGIGCLSAYCGATTAGVGAGAGVAYLYGGGFEEIAHTVVNALAINSGSICDGAKASCAAKIASSVEAGILGMQMFMCHSEFLGGDGIVAKGVENTIENVAALAREGMRETDETIIRLMIQDNGRAKA